MGQRKPFTMCCMELVIQQVSLGHYEDALGLLNEGLSSAQDHKDSMGLLEMKSIVARLRLKSEESVTYGPTTKSNGLPQGFTLAMLDVVQKVLRCQNYYEVLRVSKHATDSEIKRAYKRLALRLHPDKNQAPGAEQAFRRISEAAVMLSDWQARSEYNQRMGFEWAQGKGDSHSRRSSSCSDAGLSNSSEEEEFADELQLPPRKQYQPANQRVPQRNTLHQAEQLLMGVVATIIFMVITLNFVSSTAKYSFTQSSTYSEKRTTQQISVPYYVKPGFFATGSAKVLETMEKEIENLFLDDVKLKCMQERLLRDTMLHRARLINNRKLYQQALVMSTSSCLTLSQLREQMNYKPLMLEGKVYGKLP